MSWRKFWLILFILGTVAILALDLTNTWLIIPMMGIVAALCVADWRAEMRRHDTAMNKRITDRYKEES